MTPQIPVSEIFDLLDKVRIEQEKFTKEQLAEAVRQAIECVRRAALGLAG